MFSTFCLPDGAAFKITPRYSAYLVFMEGRPLPPRAKPTFMVLSEVRRNDDLSRWKIHFQFSHSFNTNIFKYYYYYKIRFNRSLRLV